MQNIGEYSELVQRLERLQERRPRRYRLLVALFALLGTGYVATVCGAALVAGTGIAVLIALTKNVAFAKLAWIPMLFAALVARAMWVRSEAPAGRRVRPDEAPGLFHEIENVRRALDVRKVDRVLLTQDFNAAVAQVPRLGWLGWRRNYLVIGVPLLAALTHHQFRAVLAHELAHLSRNHARFGNWIYCARLRWSRLAADLERSRSRATRLISRFLLWYAPRFNAFSFVLARANEYEADRASASVAGWNVTGAALTAVHAKGAYAEEGYWQEFYAQAAAVPEPPERPYTRYLASLANPPAEQMARGIRAALDKTTGLNDTHPALRDRLKALQAEPIVPGPTRSTAARALLGPLLPVLLEEGDRAWRDPVARTWQEKRERSRATMEALARFELEHRGPGLNAHEMFHYACCLEEVRGRDAALPVLEELLRAEPGHAGALLMRGRLRLMCWDDAGVADVAAAMDADEASIEPGAEMLTQHFEQRGELHRIEPFRARVRRLQETRELARLERSGMGVRDAIEPHGLDTRSLEAWRVAVVKQPGLRTARLVRKSVSHYPAMPCYVLVVSLGRNPFGRRRRLESLMNELPASGTCLLVEESANRTLARRVEEIPGSTIYRRQRARRAGVAPAAVAARRAGG